MFLQQIPYFPGVALRLCILSKKEFSWLNNWKHVFKRIETKYVVSKDNLGDLLADLKEYLVEDDYPTSTISNIYFDTDNFDVIKMP